MLDESKAKSLLLDKKYQSLLDYILGITSYRENPRCLIYAAMAYKGLGNPQTAITHLSESLAISENPKTIYQLAILYFDTGQLDHAIHHFQKIESTYADQYFFCFFYGKAYLMQRQHEAAQCWLEKAVVQDKNNTQLLSDFSFNCLQVGEFKKAFEIAAQLRDDSDEKIKTLALEVMLHVSLVHGDFDAAWAVLDELSALRNDIVSQKKQWRGETLTDGALLFYSGEGVGDEMMYTTLIPVLLKKVKRLIFVTDKRLIPLFSDNFKSIEWVDQKDLMSVQKAVAESGAATDGRFLMRYLIPSFQIQERCYLNCVAKKRILPEKNKSLRVGISYNTFSKPAKNRMPSQSHWEYLFASLREIQFFNLQDNAVTPKDKIGFLSDNVVLKKVEGINLYDDFSALANMISELDVVISIDNYVAHLAGRLHCPLFILLSKGHDWRWFLNRENPWYPDATLIRQTHYNRWDAVFETVIHFLKEKTC